MTPHILILEDQPDGLALLKQAAVLTFKAPQFSVAVNLAEAFLLLKQSFDYALVDLRLPDGLSIDWLQAFKHQHPTTPAVVTSLYDDDELVFAALRAGADGYLLKGDGAANLAHALAKVLHGEPPISPSIARKLMQQFRQLPALPNSLEATARPEPHNAAKDLPHLTPREQDVLGLIGSGLMIKQVASELDISPHTVNDNLKAIYRKLGIRSRAQAATEAARRGLVSVA